MAAPEESGDLRFVLFTPLKAGNERDGFPSGGDCAYSRSKMAHVTFSASFLKPWMNLHRE
jgi:hypothetical protein